MCLVVGDCTVVWVVVDWGAPLGERGGWEAMVMMRVPPSSQGLAVLLSPLCCLAAAAQHNGPCVLSHSLSPNHTQTNILVINYIKLYIHPNNTSIYKDRLGISQKGRQAACDGGRGLTIDGLIDCLLG